MRDVWNSILDRSHDNDVFSTWEWLSCWWRHFGEGRNLRILIARDRDDIVGIAPLMLSKYSFLRLGKLRKIEFIGSPQSDYNNFIFLRKEMECLKVSLNRLVEGFSDWDYLQLTDVREDSLSADLLGRMREDNPSGLERIVVTSCPYIDLPSSMDTFMERLSRNMQRNLRKRMRKLRRDHDVKFETYRDFSSLKEAMDRFFLLHQKRWSSEGEPGAFAQGVVRSFHVDVAKIFAERGWLSLYFLTVDDEAVAAVYSFDYGLKKYGYLTGFDPEYQSYSVGNLLKMCVVEDCIRRGVGEYDLGRDYEPYKADWANGIRRNLEVRMVRKGSFARAYSWATKNDFFISLTEKMGASLSLKG